MMVILMKNYLNMMFSLVVLLFSGMVVSNLFLSSSEKYQGHIVDISCHADKDHPEVYSYNIKMENGIFFRNRLNVGCDSISKLKNGDFVTIESKDHVFMQVNHDGVDLFNKKMLEVKRSGVEIAFIFLFILSGCDLGYRVYSIKKQRKSHE